MNYILARLQEPSTYAGIAAALVGLHISIDPGVWQHIADAGVALAGLAAVLLKERVPAAAAPTASPAP